MTRAASGGLLFGIPLLYTMEVWWIAEHTTPAQALWLLAFSFVPILALNRTSGFRRTGASSWGRATTDAIEAVGIALVLSFVVLVLLRQISGVTPADVAVVKVVYEAIPFTLGVGVARHFLQEPRDADDDERSGDGGSDEHREDEDRLSGTVADVAATLIGSAFIALNIAPTDEVPMLAAAMGPAWQLALVVFSVAVSYAIVFVAGFAGQRKRQAQRGILQRPTSETMAAYLVSLASAALMLAAFQRLTGPLSWQLGQVVVLGLPAAVGGAAGRLAI